MNTAALHATIESANKQVQKELSAMLFACHERQLDAPVKIARMQKLLADLIYQASVIWPSKNR
jgi:hypothetical protein